MVKFPVILRSVNKSAGTTNLYAVNFKIPRELENFNYYKIWLKCFILPKYYIVVDTPLYNEQYNGGDVEVVTYRKQHQMSYDATYMVVDIDITPLFSYDSNNDGSLTKLRGFVMNNFTDEATNNFINCDIPYYITRQALYQGYFWVKIFNQNGTLLQTLGQYHDRGPAVQDVAPANPPENIIILEMEGIDKLD